jgi:hypothetical protein
MRPDAYLSVPAAMSSEHRSSSQVRNLMAMFESNAPATDDSPPDRGRSNGHLSPAPNDDRPLSKVRSSFVSVEHGIPTSSMNTDIDPQKAKEDHQGRQESSAGLRRASFSMDENRDGDAIAQLRKTMTQEEERRDSNPMVAETIPEAAIEQTPAATTPAVEAKDYMAAGQLSQGSVDHAPSKLRDGLSADAPSEHYDASELDKPTTSPDTAADNPDKPVRSLILFEKLPL